MLQKILYEYTSVQKPRTRGIGLSWMKCINPTAGLMMREQIMLQDAQD
jgi:hypothetical protein